MATILVTNDDGVTSPGLLALKQALEEIADVMVLAPDRNWSASSHAMTLHMPLRVERVVLADGSQAHSSTGSPTDCVALAVDGVLDRRPDLVVSGINMGFNLGMDVTYSGTVACAMEATIKGIPGIAVSTVAQGDHTLDLKSIHKIAAKVARTLAQVVLQRGLPPQTLLNVNVPGISREELKGLHITRMGQRHYPMGDLIRRHDPAGRPYYWLGGTGPVETPDEGSDVGSVRNGYVSVTPITLDMTNYSFLEDLSTWEIGTGDI